MVKLLRNTFLGLLLLLAKHVNAQDTTANRIIPDTATTKAIDTSYKFPKAILVQLSSEHNRVEALAKARRYKEMETVKADIAKINAITIADFKNHLTFCPVYFYVDTNIELIKNHQFKGVLFGVDSTMAPDSVLNDTSRNYLVVHYGYPIYQSRVEDSVTKPEDKMYGSGQEPFGKGLVIYNSQFQQVSILYKFGYDNVIFRMNSSNNGYIYVSKQFDLEYFPFAGKFNSKLERMAQKMQKKKIRITHYPGADMWGLLLGKKVQ
jgi:hypothetical protein